MATWTEDFENGGQHSWTPVNGGVYTIANGYLEQIGGSPSALIGGKASLGGVITRPLGSSEDPLVISAKFRREANGSPCSIVLSTESGDQGFSIGLDNNFGGEPEVQSFYYEGGSTSLVGSLYPQTVDTWYEVRLEISAGADDALVHAEIYVGGSLVISNDPIYAVAVDDLTHVFFQNSDSGTAYARFDDIYISGNLPLSGGDAGLRILDDADTSIFLGIDASGANYKGNVTATNPLRLAFPHDIIFTSGDAMVPYSGYFWPPSTPIAPSQIYIPRGPDPITGEPNFKRTQWTITTADTPREILMGETPGGPV